MNSSNKETIVGAIVFAVLAVLLGSSYAGKELAVQAAAGDYIVIATFNRVDGLEAGSDVRLSGIKVGTVDTQVLDANYRAVVSMRIAKDVKLPTDTSAAIHTDGLFGSKYIVLDPGGEEEILESGGKIEFAQDAVIVTELLDLIISQGRAKQAERREAGKKEN